MEREDLQQYRDLSREIRHLQKKMSKFRDTEVTDTVTASNHEFPYQPITIKITGRPTSMYIKGIERATRSRLERCIILRHDIERFIAGIEDSRTRMVFERRYIDGWSWLKISMSMGSGSEATSRSIHDRYLNSRKKKL